MLRHVRLDQCFRRRIIPFLTSRMKSLLNARCCRQEKQRRGAVYPPFRSRPGVVNYLAVPVGYLTGDGTITSNGGMAKGVPITELEGARIKAALRKNPHASFSEMIPVYRNC